MNPHSTIHELNRLYSEITKWSALKSDYASDMMNHLNKMILRSLLEFTGDKIPKSNLQDMKELLDLLRKSRK